MNHKGHHIVKSQVFEINFPAPSENAGLQRALSLLIKRRLNAITEKCFDELDTVFVKTDELVLSLPDIPYEHLERLFPLHYEEALRAALKNQVRNHGKTAEEQVKEEQVRNQIEIIHHFLVKGHMPWNHRARGSRQIDALFLEFLQNRTASLLQMLRETLRADQAKLRLIKGLSKKTIHSLIERVEPTEARLIINYHSDWITVQKRKTVFKGNEVEVSRQLWLFIFRYLYNERGSYFNTRSFLISTLRQMSIQFNVPFTHIICLLRDSYQQLSQLTTGSSFNNLIADIIYEFDLAGEIEALNTPADKESRGGVNSKEPSDQLTADILSQPDMIGPAQLVRNLNRLLIDDPGALIKLLRQLARDESSVYRLIEPLEEKTIHGIIKVLEPAGASEVIAYHTELVARQQKAPLIDGNVGNLPRRIWAMIMVILIDNHGSAFNQKSFAQSLIKRIASRYNQGYFELLTKLYSGLSSLKVKREGTRLLKIVEALFQDASLKSPQVSGKESGRGNIAAADPGLIFQSIIDGKIHPRLTMAGAKSLKQLLLQYGTAQPGRMIQILQKGIDKPDFIDHFIQLLEGGVIDCLNTISSLPSYWKLIYLRTDSTAVTGLSRLNNYKLAVKELVLHMMVKGYHTSEKPIERLLLSLSAKYGLPFDQLLSYVLFLAHGISHTALSKAILQLSVRYKVQINELWTKWPAEEANSGKHVDRQQFDQLLRMVQLAFQGIVDLKALRATGFGSIDALIQYLAESKPHQFAQRLRRQLPSLNHTPGLGRDLSMSSFYQILALLSPQQAQVVISFLSKWGGLLKQGSQSMTRSFNATCHLILQLFATGEFERHAFIDDWLELLQKDPAVLEETLSLLLGQGQLDLAMAGSSEELQGLHHGRHASWLPLLASKTTRGQMKSQLLEQLFSNASPMPSTVIPYFEPKEDERTEVFIDNAGLVLLSPFFPRLFEQLGFLRQGKLEKKHREAAALALQYVMLDQPELNEESLLLNKLLCGLDTQHIILQDQFGPDQLKAQQAQVHALIRSVIGHWSVIGQCSVDGFRANWLWRQGKLLLGPDSCELHVERQSYDLLIDQLPYRFSPVNYSWMVKPLTVFWT